MATVVTPAPTSSTQPAFSWPRTSGSVTPAGSINPSIACRSVAQTPAPPIRTSTSSGGRSSGTRTLDELERPVVLAHQRCPHVSPFWLGVAAPSTSRRAPQVLEVPAHGALGGDGRPQPDRALDRPVLAQDRLCVDRGADGVDQRGLQHVERPAREGAKELVPCCRCDHAVEPRVGEPECLRGRMVPLGFADRVEEIRTIVSVAFCAARPVSGTSR